MLVVGRIAVAAGIVDTVGDIHTDCCTAAAAAAVHIEDTLHTLLAAARHSTADTAVVVHTHHIAMRQAGKKPHQV